MNLGTLVGERLMAGEHDPRVEVHAFAREVRRTAAMQKDEAFYAQRFQGKLLPREGTYMHAVLAAVNAAPEGIGAAALSNLVGIEENQVHGYLSALRNRDLIEALPGGRPKRYRAAT